MPHQHASQEQSRVARAHLEVSHTYEPEHTQIVQGYASLMRGRGFRVTPQRQMILDAIEQAGGHSTLEEIYERVQAVAPAVNRATIYRTVDFLCELRLISVAEIGGRRVCELVGEQPHHHLVCRSCGKEEQIAVSALRSLFEGIEYSQGFSVDMEHLVLLGWCGECRAKDRDVAVLSSAQEDK